MAENGSSAPPRCPGEFIATYSSVRWRSGHAVAAELGGVVAGVITPMEARWSRPLLGIFTTLTCTVPLVVGLAAIEYQSTTTSLFHQNPVPAWSLLIATWAFFLILGILKFNSPPGNGIWFHVLVRAGLLCGRASIVSSISIFIPRRYSFLPLTPLMVAPVVLAWPLLHRAYIWVADHAKNVFDNVRAKIVHWRGTQSQESALPV